MKINFYNKTPNKVWKYEKIITNIFKNNKSKKIFNIIFVTDEEIQEINRTYRGKDKVTDVITFALQDSEEMLMMAENELGDIFICVDQALRQAKEYNHSVAREIGFLSVHGYLHLLGYDHMTQEDEKEMFALQEEILQKANLTRGEKNV